ncbi:DUF503 domain-containing protein [Fundicoccus sp. Sow4_D5]|uniref:DUF503 domain-containing protein n=1 Tax=unclassified Fundicoccus TaxID=2761543 RepID=UPI003F92859C
MYIVATLLKFRIEEANSLKDKRRILKSMIQKCQQKFKVSIAEVSQQDNIYNGVIGLALVTNNQRHGESVLQKCLDFIENNYLIEVTEVEWIDGRGI